MGDKKFIEAREMKIFDEQGKEFVGWKGIVNVENTEQRFDIVGTGYKIAQHSEVVATVTKSLEELGFKNNMGVLEIGDGGRVHISIVFPDLKIDVLGSGDYISMRASLDNSYDSTTGLRLDVGGIRQGYYIYVGEKFSHYYHRHTKGLDISELENSIRKGIETFQTKIKQEFENLAGTKVDPLVISGWLNKLMEEKTKKIPAKYLEVIKNTFETVRGNITNLWSLYNLVCEVLGKEDMTIDRRKQLCQTMLSAMKGEFKKIETPKNDTVTQLTVSQQGRAIN